MCVCVGIKIRKCVCLSHFIVITIRNYKIDFIIFIVICVPTSIRISYSKTVEIQTNTFILKNNDNFITNLRLLQILIIIVSTNMDILCINTL